MIDLYPNEFLILKNGNDSVLARFLGPGLPLKHIEPRGIGKFMPKNKEQIFAIDLLMDANVKLVTLIGKAGSGKTLCALAAGLEQVIGNVGKGSKNRYKTLVITRPIQPMGKDVGYLPGTLDEKMEPWIAPIKDNLRFLITEGRKGTFNEQILNEYFENGIIEVEAMTFIRGRSIADAIIIVDEAQNLTVHELKTILTRVGENTKIILTGDIEQIDNMYLDSVSNGLSVAVEKFKTQPIAGHITLIKGERSELATIAANCL
jgi:PhoH-like ATPase